MSTPVLTRPPEVVLPRGKGPAVAAIYIGPGDVLRFGSICSSPDVPVHAVARILTPDGLVTPNEWVMPTIGDSVLHETEIALLEGWLLSLSLFTLTVGIEQGECWVRARLVRGTVPNIVPLAELLAGYIFTSFAKSWPPADRLPPVDSLSRLFRAIGTDPAAGNEISEAVGTNNRWRLRSVRYSFTTSAVVANRASKLVIDDGVNTVAVFEPPAVQAASTTVGYTWAPTGSRAAAIAGEHQCVLPPDLLLRGGYRFRTLTQNLDAGDNYGPPVCMIDQWYVTW